MCSRRGCFVDGCFKWGCSTEEKCPQTKCCGPSTTRFWPPTIHQMILDPCHEKYRRDKMQQIYGAYCGGSCPPRGCIPQPQCPCIPISIPQANEEAEPVRIHFKCPTYTTPLQQQQSASTC